MTNKAAGFSLVEILLALAAFGLIATALTGLFIYGRESGVLSGNRQRASLLAEEGLEATRNIRDQNFTNLTDGTYGLVLSGNQWTLSGSSDTTDGFTRAVTINSVDANTKEILVTVTWQQNLQRPGTVTLANRLTNWHVPASGRKGMLVYGDGGTTSDTIKYRLLQSDGTWSSAVTTADVDAATTNKALRSAQVYASSTRNEKILLSRHFDGTHQFIYAQVWNGSSWGNVQALSNWSASNFLDVQNFSGTYLSNGDFMVVFDDNTHKPEFRTWNGTSWSAQIALPDIGGTPTYIVARARPGTNEVMAAFFDQAKHTNTAYFNGGTYSTASWTVHAQHGGNAPNNTVRFADFAWSPNNTLKGGLVYADNGTDKNLTIKIWTANGSGGGSWSTAVQTSSQVSNLGALSIVGRKGANEFLACDKDAASTPKVICYKSDFTPTWSNPTNQTVAAATDSGIQASYGLGVESQSGNPALSVYSDNTITPKFKKYAASTSTWDSSPASLNALGAALETSRLVPDPTNDDIMILLADTNQDLYSLGWNGSSDDVFTAPSGKAFSSHGTNGSADEDFWYDFAWDGF